MIGKQGNIIQIIEVHGWAAVYQLDDDKELILPLALWAIVQYRNDPLAGADDEFYTMVEGIDPGGESWYGNTCSSVGNFKEYRAIEPTS